MVLLDRSSHAPGLASRFPSKPSSRQGSTSPSGRPRASKLLDDSSPRPSDCCENTTQTTQQPAATLPLGPSALAGFSTGADYIPFDISDDNDDAESLPSFLAKDRRKGKGKGRVGSDRDIRATQVRLKRSADMMESERDEDGNKGRRPDAAPRLTPWAENVDWGSCRNLAEMMHKEVKAFVAYISPTPEEHETRSMVITLITRTIQRSWPDAFVTPFGSYETKLYLPDGDIDLVVESHSIIGSEKRRALYKLASVLRKANITSNVQVIGKAKVPIIKFVTTYGRFAVDISLNQGNGVKAGRIINRLLDKLPALRSLVMVIKSFLSQRSMNEVYTGGLGSYAIVCMAVSFLQMHPKIRAAEIDPSQNLGVLVLEFFELYGHYFNYDNTGISLRDGGTYFNKIARGWDDPRHASLLSIEDPTDTSNDISKNSYNIARVRKTLAGAHEVLTAVALTRSRILMSKADGEYTRLRGPHSTIRDGTHQSILGSVMGVTQQTLNHRWMIRMLYDQNTLQDLLGFPRRRPPGAHGSSERLSPSALRHRSAGAVESAWGEADMELENSDQELPRSRLSSPEESRYSARYSRKRPRLGLPGTNGNHAEAIYVEDSEDDDLAVPMVSNIPEDDSRSRKVEARRAYWASKGMPGGDLEESDQA